MYVYDNVVRLCILYETNFLSANPHVKIPCSVCDCSTLCISGASLMTYYSILKHVSGNAFSRNTWVWF